MFTGLLVPAPIPNSVVKFGQFLGISAGVAGFCEFQCKKECSAPDEPPQKAEVESCQE
jgi:hypothetical protein